MTTLGIRFCWCIMGERGGFCCVSFAFLLCSCAKLSAFLASLCTQGGNEFTYNSTSGNLCNVSQRTSLIYQTQHLITHVLTHWSNYQGFRGTFQVRQKVSLQCSAIRYAVTRIWHEHQCGNGSLGSHSCAKLECVRSHMALLLLGGMAANSWIIASLQ